VITTRQWRDRQGCGIAHGIANTEYGVRDARLHQRHAYNLTGASRATNYCTAKVGPVEIQNQFYRLRSR